MVLYKAIYKERTLFCSLFLSPNPHTHDAVRTRQLHFLNRRLSCTANNLFSLLWTTWWGHTYTQQIITLLCFTLLFFYYIVFCINMYEIYVYADFIYFENVIYQMSFQLTSSLQVVDSNVIWTHCHHKMKVFDKTTKLATKFNICGVHYR